MERLLVLGFVAAVVVGTLVIGGAVVLGVVAVGVLLSKRAGGATAPPSSPVARATPSPIAQAPEGEVVTVVGRVEPLEPPLTSPLAARPCVLFSTELCELAHRHRMRLGQLPGGGPRIHVGPRAGVRGWQPIDARREARDFAVADASGRACVVAQDAELHLRSADHETCGGMKSPSPRMRAYLDRHHPDAPSHAMLRVEERRLGPGDRVAVRGLARWEQAAGGEETGYREGLRRLVLQPSPEAPVLVSDAPATAQR